MSVTLLLLLSALLGWFAGGLANWVADALPHWHTPDYQPLQVRHGALVHYLTLGWRPWFGATCPHCDQPRSWRAPLLEATTIVLFVLAAWRYQGAWATLGLIWLYTFFFLCVIVIDYEHRRVLNVMLFPAYPLVFLLSFAMQRPDPVQSLLGGVAGFAGFLLLAIIGRGALGMGDVKLAGLIGLMTGYPTVITALLLGIFLAGLAAIYLLIVRRASRKATMAYAPYMAVGAMVVLWLMWR